MNVSITIGGRNQVFGVQQGRQSAIILRDFGGQRTPVSNCTCWEVSPESSWRGRQEFWGWEEVFEAHYCGVDLGEFNWLRSTVFLN